LKKTSWITLYFLVCISLIITGFIRKGKTSGITIAVIPKATASSFWQMVRIGADKAAEQINAAAPAGKKCEIVWTGPKRETDREEQIQIINDQLAARVSGIVLAPNDAVAIVSPVESIFEQEIPCVIIDSGIETDKYLSFAATDNYRGGVIAAERMAHILKGSGRVIVLEFNPGSASTENRVKGFVEKIAENYPGIDIVDRQYGLDTVSTALEKAEDMLTRHSDIHGVFACNATTSTGMLQALKSQGRAGTIKFVGFDSEDQLLNGLQEGHIDSLVIQNPVKMGELGVQMIYDYLVHGKKDVKKFMDTGVALVTLENLGDPEIKTLLGK